MNKTITVYVVSVVTSDIDLVVNINERIECILFNENTAKYVCKPFAGGGYEAVEINYTIYENNGYTPKITFTGVEVLHNDTPFYNAIYTELTWRHIATVREYILRNLEE